MTLEKTGEWHLASGTWQVDDLADRDHGPQLVRTRLGHAIAPDLTPADIASLMQARGAGGACSTFGGAPSTSGAASSTAGGAASAGTGGALYPPEFLYSPVTGAQLAAPRTPAAPWVPPSGAHPVRQVTQGHVVGLRQTAAALHLHDRANLHAESEPVARIKLPPSGDYQFLSAPFGTHANGLLAIDPEKGALFAWLPASARWAPLHGAGARLVAESSLPYAAWRAELHHDFNSRIFLATDTGLACVVPDLAALQYDVRYAGDGPALGAPLAFQDMVWAPVRHNAGHGGGQGGLALVCVDVHGQPGAPVLLDDAPPLFGMGAPVGYGRTAVWPCMAGQLVLQRKPDGGFAAQFIAWPAGLAPQFAFGSPYLARDGDLWQLCFDSNRHGYAYVALGKALPEIEPALGPRLSSGSMNYRFAIKHHQAPWTEPEHGDDGAANAVVIPLLETGPRSTVGIKLASTVAVAQTLAATERLRFQLVWDDHNGETTFNTSVLPQPWTLRLFTHDGKVWAYHPELKDIIGWNLTA